MSQKGELWMGKVKPYMDENFIQNAFKKMGVDISGVRLIKTVSGKPNKYCFVQFPDYYSASLALHRLAGNLIPGSEPPVKFYLNHSISVGEKDAMAEEYSLYVSGLSPDVDNSTLFKGFLDRYRSVKSAQAPQDKKGKSKGYGFVHFAKEEERNKALIEMKGFEGIGSNALDTELANTKKVQIKNRGSSIRKAPAVEQAMWSRLPQPATGATTTQQDNSQYYRQSRNHNASSAEWPFNPWYNIGPQQSSFYQPSRMYTGYQGFAHPQPTGMQMAHSSGHDGQQQPNPWQSPMMPAANKPPLLPTPPIRMRMAHSSQYVGQPQPSPWQSAAYQAATHRNPWGLPMSRQRKAEHVDQQQNDDNEFFENTGPVWKKRK